MIYKAVFTDEFLSYFRLDDNGKTLVLTDRQGFTRAVKLEDEVEPKHGKWIPNSPFTGNCSECGVNGIKDNYCSNCGLKMDE